MSDVYLKKSYTTNSHKKTQYDNALWSYILLQERCRRKSGKTVWN